MRLSVLSYSRELKADITTTTAIVKQRDRNNVACFSFTQIVKIKKWCGKKRLTTHCQDITEVMKQHTIVNIPLNQTHFTNATCMCVCVCRCGWHLDVGSSSAPHCRWLYNVSHHVPGMFRCIAQCQLPTEDGMVNHWLEGFLCLMSCVGLQHGFSTSVLLKCYCRAVCFYSFWGSWRPSLSFKLPLELLDTSSLTRYHS